MRDQSGRYGRGFDHVSDDEIYKFARKMNAKVALFVHVDEDYLLTQREWSSNSSAAKSNSNKPKKRIIYENFKLACGILPFKILDRCKGFEDEPLITCRVAGAASSLAVILAVWWREQAASG